MWLFIGGDSEIGAATQASMRSHGRDIVATTRRPNPGLGRIMLDLNQPLDAWEPPPRAEAACIFAAAARLADCAADPVTTSRINITQTLTVVERLNSRGIYVLFLSTNQVFDGRSSHVPTDAPTAPVSEYGRQKAQTEAALRERMARGAPIGILRLAKVISPRTTLLREWSTALASGKRIRAFRDMTMAPAPIEAVAGAIEALLNDRASGIYQLTGPRDVTYSDVAFLFAAQLKASRSLIEETSVTTAGLPRGIAPPHTTLDSTLLRERYAISVADAPLVLETTLRQISLSA
jgi:dTDP-4-dehydrorhamnose reductase